MNTWAIVGLIGAGTFALRSSFLAFPGDRAIPDRVRRALRFVPAAVLTAITVPAVAYVDGDLALALSNHRFPAAVVAAAVAWKTKNIAWTIVAGLGVQWLLSIV
ncbi:MAG: AzlD domain-containing protein [Acidimicrobiia bacterium]|nr:AzlD domain-containing protein [Acidimicrobiia bacterium]